jgi:sugar/nucleoside kinase (ribokinase family)
MPDIVAIGEVLVEIMRPTAGQPLDQPGVFKGPYPSGAPAIFAVAAARLGLDVGFIGAVGEDAFGRQMGACFQAEGVDASQLQISPEYATGAAFVAYDLDGSREFVFHIRHAAAGALSCHQLQESYFQGIKWLHISGSTLFMNENSRRACQRAWAFTQAQEGRLSLDPNLRPELMPIDQAWTVLEPFLSAADLILPTVAEVRAISGQADETQALQALGLKQGAVAVLKRGMAGCSIYYDGRRLDCGSYQVQEIDPTGAGDCFSAAFIAGLETDWSLEQVGSFANAAGALAVTRMGPMEGAPTKGQIATLLKKGNS